ncbi:hypothetical protein CVT26_009597 [Gymnopilus dilepis]|uniref:Uncharacterized protein n=1 Tax=Gymnopilus dilepis TaxID=231916 RepID=A0A409YIF8_9AGAR|nr:hypothetical protein CVT26_009597 [Gymnopilus dilepis]
MTTLPPYQGRKRKLVIAFDVGTTYSGISFVILDPGQVPEIKGVTKFPAQEHVSGASKIPTVMYYDRAGKVRAAGAEASVEGIFETAEEEQWIKTEWWKLHLRSKYGAGRHLSSAIPALPLNKTIVEIFADFLKYLFECLSTYIKSTYPNGDALWKSLSGDIDFVLSHPNGWEGSEQTQMRKAAVVAGLIPDTTAGHARLSFVTEGEASLHFAIHNGLPKGVLQNGEGVVIVDAGGGTVDISSYRKNPQTKAFEEIASPQSYFHGSVFVTVHAEAFLENFLSGSPFAEDLDHIVRTFDKTTKLRFKSADEMQFIKFGSTRDNDPAHNIRFGQLKLPGSEVAHFFQPSVDCIVSAVLEQKKASSHPISHVILVGGFAQSPWLYDRVQSSLTPSGIATFVPEGHVNKAVSHGTISFYLDHFVQSRISKFTYGTMLEVPYNPNDLEHQRRLDKVYTTPAGEKRVPRGFDVILPKGTQVSESSEFRKTYTWISDSKQAFKFMDSIWCYRGSLANPKWKDEDTENYSKVCYIEVDLSHVKLDKQRNVQTKKKFYTVQYSIVLLFGMTELKAQIAWTENGVEKRSPAKIIYDPNTKDV